jgi:riboflavin kinase
VEVVGSVNEIHYTDYSFQKLCEMKFGINRGVYNTIDAWFYHNGVKNTLTRRRKILDFLSLNKNNNKNLKLKFGKGNLIQKLNEFWLVDNTGNTNFKDIL